MRFALAFWCAAALLARDVVVPKNSPKPVGPYSPGIVAGGFLYVSGQGMRRPDNSTPEGIEAQTRQCLENVKAIVEAGGLTMEHVVYTQIYLADISGQKTVEKVWKEFFPKNPPAHAMLGVYRMPTDTQVEINAIAIRDLSRKRQAKGAVVAGDRVFLSGVFGKGDTPEAQVQDALDHWKGVLAGLNLDLRHVVFVNPYLTAAMPMEAMNRVYAKHFEFGNTPARATIRVNALPGNSAIEFTGVAVMDLSNRRAVRPKNMAPSPTASPCVWASDTLYCSAKSGFIPGPQSGIWADDVENQVRQSMRNLLDGLEEAGLDFSHAVASNVYVDNLDEFSKMNAVYGKYFTSAPPTRTTVAPVAPVERKRDTQGRAPKLEEVSIIAVKE
jgi:2-iminobutanoate/2-iminopropanoate deaminase